MKCGNAYENENMQIVTGETLRPGGFVLTDKGVEFCKFSSEDPIMDVGCGMGATVNYLYKKYGIKAIGIDPSDKLIDMGKKNYEYTNFIQGKGEKIPFQNESFQGIFAECTLSIMDNLDSVIKEVFRTLKNRGYFIITDVYAKNPEFTHKLSTISINSCMRGLHDLDLLSKQLVKQGFKIMLLEDCSFMLKQLMVKIIFSYGSMSVFWNKSTECCIDGQQFEKTLKSCKPGYFIMIARKGDEDDE